MIGTCARLAVLSLAVLCGAGCAGIKPAPPASMEPDELILRIPLAQVWPEAERLLFERGWQVEFRDGNVLTTSWRVGDDGQLVGNGTGTELVERVVVVGRPLAAGHCLVKVARQSRPLRMVELGKSLGHNVLGHENSNTTGQEWHAESHQVVGPELPIRISREEGLEEALVDRLQLMVERTQPHVPEGTP